MADRYAAAPRIRMLDFGDEWVIFNPVSWDAHVLNPAAVLVLDQLSAEALTEAEIAGYLRDVLVDAEQAQASAYAQRLIDELVLLGLVRPVSADAAANR